MANEPIDQRRRRRLFGRRRVESVEESPKVGQVTVTESSVATEEAAAAVPSEPDLADTSVVPDTSEASDEAPEI